MSINKRLEDITENDLKDLVDNKYREIKSIDYKVTLPGNSDSEKKEFLADVSSFANANGGDLIYGIKANDGLPVNVCGLPGINPDAEVLRLESMNQSGISPRIPGISTRPIPLKNSDVVVVMRIPKSWASPHMVIFKDHCKFYSRNSAGKYRLDVQELKSAFLLSETAAERIRNFRIDRIHKIIVGETPMPLGDDAKIILHLVPINAFDVSTKYDLTSLGRGSRLLYPIYTVGYNDWHNFDGFLTFNQDSQAAFVNSYMQIFHNGCIEAVETRLLRNEGREKLIPSVAYEKALIEALSNYLLLQKQLGVATPLFVMLSLVGVSGYIMSVDPSRRWAEDHSIDRNELMIPESVVDSYDVKADKILKPIFDRIWNAAGWPYSNNFDQEGKWVGKA